MLRRISTVVAATAALGLCALPAYASSSAAHASKGNFTVPNVGGVKAWGSYDKINAFRVKVTICTQRTSGSGWVGAEAFAYNSNYSQKVAIAAVVGPETPGSKSCGSANLLETSHLKVFTFLGSNGRIVKKSSLKSIY
jgi:hypothetical protein